MPDAGYCRIPLRRIGGQIFAEAIVDLEYAHLARMRWYLDGRGYVSHSVTRGPELKLHRVILGLIPRDGLEADHINRDKLDNRRANLRIVTTAQNAQNKPSI